MKRIETTSVVTTMNERRSLGIMIMTKSIEMSAILMTTM
jgi:hypothetical protein